MNSEIIGVPTEGGDPPHLHALHIHIILREAERNLLEPFDVVAAWIKRANTQRGEVVGGGEQGWFKGFTV